MTPVAVLALLAAACLVWLPVTGSLAQQPRGRQLAQVAPIKEWPGRSKRWALVIGVDKYRDRQISRLSGADNDARSLRDALINYAGFPEDQVILLATDQPEERQPTRINILTMLSNLGHLVKPDGLLLVSFAGHGTERGGQAYLIPSDARLSDDVSLLEESAVSVQRMHQRIKDTGVGQVVVLLDACRNDPGGRADAPNPLTTAYTRAFNFDLRNQEVQAYATFYATAVGQRAYEYTEKNQGYFTWAIVEGLAGAAANEKGEVTLSALVNYVQEVVPKRIAIDLGTGKQQKPFAEVKGYRYDELVIAVSPRPVAPIAANPSIPTPAFDLAAVELAFWNSIKDSKEPEDYQAYLDKYPNGQFASLARRRVAKAAPDKTAVAASARNGARPVPTGESTKRPSVAAPPVTPSVTPSGTSAIKIKLPIAFVMPRLAVEQFTLANGLRVVLSPGLGRSVVSVAVYYHVGSRNERPGRNGYAHLFEHMMFAGSENIPKGSIDQYIGNKGGILNGSTDSATTKYYETVPAAQLPLALWLESDRMRSLKITQQNLDNERAVVKEEKRLVVDNNPYGRALQRIQELVYKNPANAQPVIGSIDDLNAASLSDVQEFWRAYYSPNNAVLSIAGDFDVQETRRLVEKYFGTIPRQSAMTPVDVSEPTEVAQRQDTLDDKLASLPAFILGWKIPARQTPDFYALQLASDLLCKDDNSRLVQKFVKGDESLTNVRGWIDDQHLPAAFYVLAMVKPGKDVAQVRQAVLTEIKRLASDGPTDEEMWVLQNKLSSENVRGMQSSLFRAERTAEFALFEGDAQLISTEPSRYLSVTPAQIKAAVARYLDTDNHATLNIVPASK